MSMKEISEKMNLKVGTVYNIVQTLTSRGFLQNVHRRFEIGPSLGLAASHWDIENSLPHLVTPILMELQEKTGEPSCVTILVQENQAEIITPQKHNPDVSMRFTHTTWKHPLYLATGRVLVAFGPNEKWEAIIEEQLKNGPVADAEKQWRMGEWLEHLLEIREKGFAVIAPRRAGEGGVSSVAVPLFNTSGEIIASIGASTRGERATRKHLEEMKDRALQAVENHPLSPGLYGERQ
jgi:DNA-binding IclR family transcriptional regulator